MIAEIINNPFRILGVYGNSPLKDIVANKAKMNAFLKVGKAVSFPLDLPGLLGEVERTPDRVAAADSKLTIESDKLCAAQFWFMTGSPLDTVAFKHLQAGNVQAAVEVWAKQDNVSSLQNRAVCCLLQNDVRGATACLDKLYSSHRDQWLTAMGLRNMPHEDLVEGYIAVMMEQWQGIDFQQLSGAHCSPSWNEAAKAGIMQPLVKSLTDAITDAKQTKGKEPRVRLEAGKKLIAAAKPLLFQLRQLLPTTDPQLINISDKVCNEALQCGIDFYNDSDSPFVAEEAMEQQRAASMFAMGSMMKSRCDDNINILQGIIDNLPSEEVAEEVQEIRAALQRFCELPDEIVHSVTLLDETEKPLQAMKQKLGASHADYIKESSLVAGNALHNLIAEVNARISLVNQNVMPASTVLFTLTSAKNVIDRIAKMDLNDETRTRVNNNRNTLNGLVSQAGGKSEDRGGCWIQLLVAAIIMLLIYTCNN